MRATRSNICWVVHSIEFVWLLKRGIIFIAVFRGRVVLHKGHVVLPVFDHFCKHPLWKRCLQMVDTESSFWQQSLIHIEHSKEANGMVSSSTGGGGYGGKSSVLTMFRCWPHDHPYPPRYHVGTYLHGVLFLEVTGWPHVVGTFRTRPHLPITLPRP